MRIVGNERGGLGCLPSEQVGKIRGPKGRVPCPSSMPPHLVPPTLGFQLSPLDLFDSLMPLGGTSLTFLAGSKAFLEA